MKPSDAIAVTLSTFGPRSLWNAAAFDANVESILSKAEATEKATASTRVDVDALARGASNGSPLTADEQFRAAAVKARMSEKPGHIDRLLSARLAAADFNSKNLECENFDVVRSGRRVTLTATEKRAVKDRDAKIMRSVFSRAANPRG